MSTTTEELKAWKPEDITREQFEWLGKEWSAGMCLETQVEVWRKEDDARLTIVERLIDAAPWEYDDDGNIVPDVNP